MANNDQRRKENQNGKNLKNRGKSQDGVYYLYPGEDSNFIRFSETIYN